MVRDSRSVDWPSTEQKSKEGSNQFGKVFLFSILSLLALWPLALIFSKFWLFMFTVVFMAQLTNPELDGVIAELNAVSAAAIMTSVCTFFLWVIVTGIYYHVISQKQ